MRELGDGAVALAGGTEVVPLLRDGILAADTLVELRDVLPRGIRDGRIGAGATLAELEADPQIPTRCGGVPPRRVAAAPEHGHDRRQPAAGDALLVLAAPLPCRLHGGERCFAREGEHREHAIFANDFCASAHPSDPAAALVALGATLHTDRRTLAVADLYRLPTEEDRRTTTLEPGELIVEIEVPTPDASVYLKAMERRRWSFPIVGVAAARFGGEIRIALAGVAPIPWLLAGAEALDAATPLPGTAFKVEMRPASRRPGAPRRDLGSAAMRPLALLIAALALLAAGCGGDDEATETAPSTTGTGEHDDGRGHTAEAATGTTEGRTPAARHPPAPREEAAPTGPRAALDEGTTYSLVFRDELRLVHRQARPGDRPRDVRLARAARARRVLRRHDLPPHRPRLRDPGRRSHADRRRWAWLLDGGRAAAGRHLHVWDGSDGEDGNRAAGDLGSQFFVVTAPDAGLPPSTPSSARSPTASTSST